MGETMIRVLEVAVLPYRNGRHVPHAPGDIVALSKLTDAVARALRSGDRLLANLLEPY
jgi:hypothetical protein